MKEIKLTEQEKNELASFTDASYLEEYIFNWFTDESSTFYKTCWKEIDAMCAALENAIPSLLETQESNICIENNGTQIWVADPTEYDECHERATCFFKCVLFNMPELHDALMCCNSCTHYEATQECHSLAYCLIEVIEEQIISSQIYILENPEKFNR